MRWSLDEVTGFEHAPLPMVVIDEAARPVVVNAAWRREAGQPAAPGRDARLPPEVIEEACDAIGSSREGLVLETAVARDLPDRTFRARVRPLLGDDGRARGAVIAFEDMSGELAAQRALELQRKLVGYAAHELQTPLMALTLWHGMLVEPGTDVDRPRALAAIASSAHAMGETIAALRDITRATAGTMTIDRVAMPVAPLLHDAHARAAPAAAARPVELVRSFGLELGAIQGNAYHLGQVLDLLLTRAIGAAGARIVLTARRATGALELIVEHDGRGIAREHLPHILQPFAGHDRSEGLGLARVAALVSLHDGQSEVHSDGPDAGARYVVRLPATDACVGGR